MFCLTIKTSNAAFFEDDGEATGAAVGAEIARILRYVAEQTENGLDAGDSGPCMDLNGNQVGEWQLARKEA